MAILVPMSAEYHGHFINAAIESYAAENVAAGQWRKAGAWERSQAILDALLPQGLATPKNYFFEIKDADCAATVGSIWFAIAERNGGQSVHVYDVHIIPKYRRQGHATHAFNALEVLIRQLGISTIGLHVFYHNLEAQALYTKLGYMVTGINMRKFLGDESA